MNNKLVKESASILIGSILYGLATVLFIFPHSVVLGGTSGIAVILNNIFPDVSPGTCSVIMNTTLIIVAFFVLGKEMASKTLAGSFLTTVFIGFFEYIFGQETFCVSNIFVSSLIGCVIIAFASALMFYVDSSSGGTDIIALIVKKYFKIHIGKALLITDCFILITGGVMYGRVIFAASLIGLLIKTLGIDFIISQISKRKMKNGKSHHQIWK